jgi:hypothetical protein
VFEGFPLAHAIRRLAVAGADATAHLVQCLGAAGQRVDDGPSGVARRVKESVCVVADGAGGAVSEAVFELPDGRVLRVPPTARTQPCELLFNPKIIGERALSVRCAAAMPS